MMMKIWTTTPLSLSTMVADEKGALDRLVVLVVLAVAVGVVQGHKKAIYKEEKV